VISRFPLSKVPDMMQAVNHNDDGDEINEADIQGHILTTC